MLKKFKKLLLFSCSLLIGATILATNVQAYENKLTIGESTNSIQPLGELYCDSSPNGIHQMFARGIGILYRLNSDGSKTLIYNNGCTWQCSYCLTVMLTKGEAAQGQAIGNYATWNPGYVTQMGGTVLTASNIWYTSSSRISGYNFRYN